MKSKGLVMTATVLLSVLVLGGCSTGTKKNSSTNSSTEKATSTYYQNLSKADKKNVQFKFTLSQDETKDNSADPVYMVSMKVTNKTNKTIKFHKDKFIYALPEDKILSSGSGVLNVQSGKSKNIDQMFDSVPEQGTLGDGVIEYLNSNNKLAYAKFVNNVATSKNLTDKTLSRSNADTTGNSETGNNSNTSSSVAKTSSTATQASSTTSSSSSSAQLTEAQAAQKLQAWANSNGATDFDVNTLTPSQGGGGYGFTDDNGSSWFVDYSGNIHAPGDPVTQ